MSSTIKIEPLGRHNFDTWKVHIEALLIRSGGWKYVSGTCQKPNDEAAAETWVEEDLKARSDLILAISPSELKLVKGIKTSREVWTKLHEVYQSKGPARKALLLKRLILQRMKSGDDVRDHVVSFFDTVDKLQDMEITINDDLLSIMMLYSLPEEFENFRVAIESRDEVPKPEALRTKILEESEARNNKNSNEDPNAMMAKKKFVHWKSQKKKLQENSESEKKDFRYRCYKCKQVGHKSSQCPEKVQRAKTAESEVSYHMAMMAQQTAGMSWCLDSGCTSHMCNDHTKFTELAPTQNVQLKLANTTSTDIKARGPVDITTRDGKIVSRIRLKDTLYVPDLRTGLLSVSKMTDNGFQVLFTKDKATVFNSKQEKVICANRINGLYYVKESEVANKVETIENPRISNLTMWHNRYGHLNEVDLKKIVKSKAVHGVNFNINEKLPTCIVCLKGKMTQTRFPTKSEKEVAPLEIVHSDVWGPARTESNGGSRYYVTFIDEATRWCVVTFMKAKSETLKAFKAYKEFAENQKGTKIKFLQSDNGGEYDSREFKDFLENCGIGRRLTVPGTPQQNGLSERMHRTILNIVRCMLVESKLPHSFWAEAVATAVHIRNRSPCSGINEQIPFELWVGRAPVVSYFRTFGSRAFALDKTKKGKLEPRSKECIFVGYSDISKAYRVWDIQKKKIFVTRDIKFVNEDESKEIEGMVEDFEIGVGIPMENRNNETHVKMTATQSEEIPRPETETRTIDEIQHNEENDIEQQAEVLVRGRGRPKLVKTSEGPGRRKKVFNMVPNNSSGPTISSPEPNNDLADADEEDVAGMVETERFLDMFDNAWAAEIKPKEAFSSENAEEWQAAVRKEFSSLLLNDTWMLEEKPKEHGSVGCRLILVNKYTATGELDRRKARLVAKGYTQEPGIDYHETYSPVVRLSSLRTVMALAVEHDMEVIQMDVETAYLNGDLDEHIYMDPPEQFEMILMDLIEKETGELQEKAWKMLRDYKSGKTHCKLKKSLYGLKQSGRQWFLKLDEKLRMLGLKPSTADPCVYTLGDGEDIVILTVYVDDLVLASKNNSKLTNLRENLKKEFKMKDMGQIHYCLGLEIDYQKEKGVLKISQKKYTQEILKKFNMEDSKPVVTPFDLNLKFEDEFQVKEEFQNLPYRKLIGSLMYLTMGTRVDITYAVNYLSQFNSKYSDVHWKAAKRILRYLKGTSDHGIEYKRSGNSDVVCFVDADWGNCKVEVIHWLRIHDVWSCNHVGCQKTENRSYVKRGSGVPQYF